GTSGAGSILGFASPSATNEALFLFKRYLSGELGVTQFDFRVDSEDKNVTRQEDEILRRFDKHPNSMGAIKLGLMSAELGGIEGAIRAASDGRIKAAIVIYLKPLVRRPLDEEAERRVIDLVGRLEYSVVLATHKAEWHTAASVVLPVAGWSEEEGTYTNFHGRVQFAGKAVEPGGNALPLWEVFAMLLHASGAESPWMAPAQVFSSMAENEAAYRGLSPLDTRLPGVVVE
ncbi:MAG TPA: molybdopterin-dependent oxidoreductase, partial [Blastocatellia bacterium]|nr:molybdopterin-dependent oxidoreductase [Blastocatellia bacterium]